MSVSAERSSGKKRTGFRGLDHSLRVQIPPPHIRTQPPLPLHHNHHTYTTQHGQTNQAQYGPESRHSSSDSSQFITEHEIKFTKNEICTPSTCICFFIAFLFSFMAILSGIYYGLNYFDGKQLKERVFKAQFVVHNQEFLSVNLEKSDSNEFKSLSNSLKTKIDTLFRQSSIDQSYLKSEIIAFERKRNSVADVIIHFNVHVSVGIQNVETSDIYMILAEEIMNNKLKVFADLTIDHNSVDVQERKWMFREKSTLLLNPWTYKSIFPGMLEGLSTEPTPMPRKCASIGLQYCRSLSYNYTSYPNAVNHWNLSSVEEDFIIYKEIIDSECYSLAKEFLCNLLQPECVGDEMILPCKEFCSEFYTSCQRWLPDKLLNKIDCSTFPERQVQGKNKVYLCRHKPNCAARLRLQAQEYKICDGIFDCSDKSDEMKCSYCNIQNSFYCGNRQCVSTNVTCDGVKDCLNGADEVNCLALLSLAEQTPEDPSLSNEGFLRATYKGRQSYVCSQSGTSLRPQNYTNVFYNNQLQILGLNICNENQFEELIQIDRKSINTNGPFTKFVPGTTLISPYSTQCKNREIYHVKCAISKCGLNFIYSSHSWADSDSSKAWPGYWPWFVKVNLNGNYLCDGTLISPDTVLAQAACFSNHQAQLKKLTVILGSVRLNQDNLEAKRVTVARVETVVPHGFNQKLSLLKLDNLLPGSSHIRPICHNRDISLTTPQQTSALQCVVVSLSLELDRLQQKPAKIVDMDKCRYSTIALTTAQSPFSNGSSSFRGSVENTNNKLCVELEDSETALYSPSSNNAECSDQCSLVTGRHLYCLSKHSWHLFAIEQRLIHSPLQSQDSSGNKRNLILFQILSKLSL